MKKSFQGEQRVKGNPASSGPDVSREETKKRRYLGNLG